jgi:uncharacterized protein
MSDCIMKHEGAADETICAILTQFRRIAIVGLSEKPWRASHRVASYLLEHGYDIIPVNPRIKAILGMTSYPNLFSVSGPVEVVNVFRRAEHIPEIVQQAVEIGARAVWMQAGLEHQQAAEFARHAGLLVVMNRCIMVEHGLHFG